MKPKIKWEEIALKREGLSATALHKRRKKNQQDLTQPEVWPPLVPVRQVEEKVCVGVHINTRAAGVL